MVAESLGSSPLFNLSLSSKELFHSNFLAWLCQAYPRSAGKLFSAYLPDRPGSCAGLRVLREKNHIDLWLKYSDGSQLIIENKVKSMPLHPQLEQYAAEHVGAPATGFLLLSLERPSFLAPGENRIRMSNGVVWQCLSYRELADELRKLLPDIHHGYHAGLLEDYCDFIDNLAVLQARFSVNWGDARGDFFEIGQDRECLRVIRLHDLFDKLRYSGLAQHVIGLLGGEFTMCQDFKRIEAGEAFVTSGMTRGTGLFDFKYCLCGHKEFGYPVILGLQLQGNDFRLVVEIEDRKQAARISQCLLRPDDGNRVWFDFRLLSGGSQEYPHKEGKDFNQYDGQFLYRSKRLDHISPQLLADTIVAYAKLARDNAPLLRQQIGAPE
jgi:hypothetical protein